LFDLGFLVVQEQSERLDQVVVGQFVSKSICELGEVLREREPHLPGLVLSSGEQSAHCVDLVLVFCQVLGHWDKTLDTQNTDLVLLILRQLSESGQQLLQDVLFVKLGREKPEFRGARSPDHGSVVVAKFNKLLS